MSSKFRVDPALVAGILASEILYDYDATDQHTDQFRLDFNSHAYGYANVHADTAERAYDYLKSNAGSAAVDIIPLDPVVVTRFFKLPDFGQYDTFVNTPQGNIAVAALVARWLVDPYIASLVTTDNPNPGQIYQTANAATLLSTKDMAIIFSAYRTGVGNWSPGDPNKTGFESVRQYQDALTPTGSGLGCNARLAFPVMKYMQTQFP